MEQEATLRIPIANVPMPQPLPPAHLVIQPQIPSMQSTSEAAYLPNVHAMMPPAAQMAPYASAPAANASHMVLSTTPQQEPEDSSPRSIARVQSVQSSAPSSARSNITAPDMSHRTPSEQAVIQALQAVANYPESREFVKSMSEQLPGLLEAPGPSTSSNTPGPSNTRTRAPSPISGLSPVSDEELGRKRTSQLGQSPTVSTTDSPTSRPPPDKRLHALRSVVIQEPTKVGYHGVHMPQMTMNEAIERYTRSPSSSANAERSSTSVTSSASRSTKPTPPP